MAHKRARRVANLNAAAGLAYQVTFPLVEVHPFDQTAGLMQGEILYMGEPTEIIPACR